MRDVDISNAVGAAMVVGTFSAFVLVPLCFAVGSPYPALAFYSGYVLAWFIGVAGVGVGPVASLLRWLKRSRRVPLVVPDVCRLLEDPFEDWAYNEHALKSRSSGISVEMDGSVLCAPMKVEVYGRASRMLRHSIDIAQQNLLRRATGELPPPSDLRLLLDTKGQ